MYVGVTSCHLKLLTWTKPLPFNASKCLQYFMNLLYVDIEKVLMCEVDVFCYML